MPHEQKLLLQQQQGSTKQFCRRYTLVSFLSVMKKTFCPHLACSCAKPLCTKTEESTPGNRVGSRLARMKFKSVRSASLRNEDTINGYKEEKILTDNLEGSVPSWLTMTVIRDGAYPTNPICVSYQSRRDHPRRPRNAYKTGHYYHRRQKQSV